MEVNQISSKLTEEKTASLVAQSLKHINELNIAFQQVESIKSSLHANYPWGGGGIFGIFTYKKNYRILFAGALNNGENKKQFKFDATGSTEPNLIFKFENVGGFLKDPSDFIGDLKFTLISYQGKLITLTFFSKRGFPVATFVGERQDETPINISGSGTLTVF